MKQAVLAFFIVLLSACGRKGTVIVVSGFEVYDRSWNEAVRGVSNRAAFDLECPAEQLELTLIEKQGRWPTQVGASGCGRRALYVRLMPYQTNSWVMNSAAAQ